RIIESNSRLHTAPPKTQTLCVTAVALGFWPVPVLLQMRKDKDANNKVFKNLDGNGDFQVDFKDFDIFVAALI
uniref:EF-hand domain-containing protein n=1 Tax=Coturnix japonica TaxID=93934 RepID=A0A8C2U9P2_COTJA